MKRRRRLPSTTTIILLSSVIVTTILVQCCSSFSISTSTSSNKFLLPSLCNRLYNSKAEATINSRRIVFVLAATKGFGATKKKNNKKKNNKKSSTKKNKNNSGSNKGFGVSSVAVIPPTSKVVIPPPPPVMIQQQTEQERLLESLQRATADNPIGKAVASSPYAGTPEADPFWELVPVLINSKFPSAANNELERVAGMVRHAVNPDLPFVEETLLDNPYRPEDDIHAYMPGLGPTTPFYDTTQFELCRRLSENYDIIRKEYEALVNDIIQNGNDRFQSVTSMNYDSGWRTLVLFYNGHRIPGFPYHLCPTTTQIMESVPLAGRIAGFNRQQPQSGIPKHTDGNNMWLTCQMGITVPSEEDHDGENPRTYIQVGPEVRPWTEGQCLLYDTTYEHETFNGHHEQERVVLHIDFFNIKAMTKLEIDIMQYIYNLREEFMKAEGVAKVGAQVL